MIRIQNLSKRYGDVTALQDISCEIGAGEIVGLLGPNGAGKTTTIKILTGYLQPGAGSVEVDGLNVLTHRRQVQSRIGYLPESAPLYPELSVQGYLHMMADLRQIPRSEQGEYISDAVYATALADHLTRPIGELSKGYRQRVGLAQAILHRPKLLILDEPTVGLDPTQIVEIRRLIRRLAQNSTILFSTHILSEVEALCDRVIILMNGEIKADARLAELAGASTALLVLQEQNDEIAAELSSLEGVVEVSATESRDGFPALQVLTADDVDILPQLFQLAGQKQWPVRELRRDRRTLESIFNQLATSI